MKCLVRSFISRCFVVTTSSSGPVSSCRLPRTVNQNESDPQKIVDDPTVHLQLASSLIALLPLVIWTSCSDAISQRIGSDIAFLDSLAKLGQLGLLVWKRTMSNNPTPSAAGLNGDLIYRYVVDILGHVVHLNPWRWIEVLKTNGPNAIVVRNLRNLALETLLQISHFNLEFEARENLKASLDGGVKFFSLALGQNPIVDPVTRRLSFRPLPEDRTQYATIFANAIGIPVEISKARIEQVKDFCDVCGSSENLEPCTRCLVGRFCSQECVEKGREEHKKVCFDGSLGHDGNAEDALRSVEVLP